MSIPAPTRRLPLAGAKNARDLGGYPCPGGTTRWRAFVRSDNPGALTPEDIAYLQAYGVNASIDLRHPDECLRSPSSLASAPGFVYHPVSVNNEFTDLDFEGDVPGSMSGFYIALMDKAPEAMARVFRLMAEAEGGVLFHCAVGKDRTGLVAMLLLQLAGVGDTDIVADYAVTDIYMKEIFDAQAAAFKNDHVPDYVLRSKPVSMHRTLAHLHQRYRDAAGYFAAIGLTEAEIALLKDRLVEPTAP